MKPYRINEAILNMFFEAYNGIVYQAYDYGDFIKVIIIHQKKNFSLMEIRDKLSDYVKRDVFFVKGKNDKYVSCNELHIIL